MVADRDTLRVDVGRRPGRAGSEASTAAASMSTGATTSSTDASPAGSVTSAAAAHAGGAFQYTIGRSAGAGLGDDGLGSEPITPLYTRSRLRLDALATPSGPPSLNASPVPPRRPDQGHADSPAGDAADAAAADEAPSPQHLAARRTPPAPLRRRNAAMILAVDAHSAHRRTVLVAHTEHRVVVRGPCPPPHALNCSCAAHPQVPAELPRAGKGHPSVQALGGRPHEPTMADVWEVGTHDLVLRMETLSDGTPDRSSVVAGSLRVLVGHLADEAWPDAHYIDCFLLTYRHIATAEELMAELAARFHVVPPADASDAELAYYAQCAPVVQLRTLCVIKKWLATYPDDLRDSAGAQLVLHQLLSRPWTPHARYALNCPIPLPHTRSCILTQNPVWRMCTRTCSGCCSDCGRWCTR
jgi:hypothetical protein